MTSPVVIAIVMDLFTDVDIMCDLVAAASKRKVPVYLLLDEKNLGYFIEMWEKLDFKSIQVPNLRVRTLTGSTYCTKSGKKFSGQFLEKFILIDCEQVIAGTYSFSWIASQVHSNMVTLFIGKIVEDFDTEFRCLYAVSNKVDYFSNADSNISPYSRPLIWNTQPILRLAPEATPSNGSSSHSDSTISSLKASQTSTSYKVINKDKHAPPDLNNDVRQDVNGGFGANFINERRRLSNPNTLADKDHSFGLHNLGLRTSLLSKSTPALNQFEPVPNFTLGTITERAFSQNDHKTGSTNANVDSLGQEEISKEQSHNISRNDKRMTLGHSHLDMMMSYRRQGLQALMTNNQQTDHKPFTAVKSNVSRFQADTANPTHLVGRKDMSKEKNSTLNEDEKTMTLGHSKLDMITKFRPQTTNNIQAENLASTNMKSDSSQNQTTNSNYTENKRDVPTNLTGLKASMGGNQNTLSSDEKTMTLGHSRLDMITKYRPQPTTGMAGLQSDYKTPSVLKSDVSANHTADDSRTEEVKDTCTHHVSLKDDLKESTNLSRNDKRMTLGHSKLDMITNHNKGKPTKAYSRFRP
ncbi:hypothetical protein NDU88_003013 [Pleurodeles waltl]|uniref:Scaffolding anchor of CK1 domain-containing protein n=1 Tax=Pleurodeles waltl TaxID=8319 RepID=A0AAV7PDG0_PLEWA|nr:hypothetical protein NDU88_003013 [Pleurodeles waltl]